MSQLTGINSHRHNMPMDTSSTRSARSRGSISDVSSSPAITSMHMPRLPLQYPSSALPQTSSSTSMGGEKVFPSSDYRTHSVPPSLHDHLSSQPIGTAPCGLAPEILYGLSPSGDSLYSSSDSCYSPHLPIHYEPRGPFLSSVFNLAQSLSSGPNRRLRHVTRRWKRHRCRLVHRPPSMGQYGATILLH